MIFFWSWVPRENLKVALSGPRARTLGNGEAESEGCFLPISDLIPGHLDQSGMGLSQNWLLSRESGGRMGCGVALVTVGNNEPLREALQIIHTVAEETCVPSPMPQPSTPQSWL